MGPTRFPWDLSLEEALADGRFTGVVDKPPGQRLGVYARPDSEFSFARTSWGTRNYRPYLIPVTEIGNSLREARIRKGLTIRDVEDATKIRARYLQALEQDDFDTLPGPVFVKAFLRTYATFLGLSADELVEAYASEHEPANDVRGGARMTAARRGGGSSQGYRRTAARGRRTQRGYFVVGVLAVIAVALLAWFGSSRGEENAGTPLENASFTAASTVPPQGTSTTTASSALRSTTAVSRTAASTGDNVVLVISVTQDNCWMIVREDNESGAELYAGTLSAGGENTFDSAKSYWLHVGRPEVLVLTINGRPVSLEKDQHFYLVTESGVKPLQ